MASQAVICPACGAKIKEGRPKCLRCGQELEGATASIESTTEQGPQETALGKVPRQRVLFIAAGILVPMVLVYFALNRQPPPYQPPAPFKSAVEPKSVQPVPPRSDEEQATAAADLRNERFFDPDRSGRAAFNGGDFNAAVLQYQAAIQKNPNDLESLNNLGQALVRLNRAQEAIPYFEKAIALNTANWAPRFNLAHAYGAMNDWPKAITEYRGAAAAFPDDYVTHYNLGLALHKAGQEDGAVQEYQKAIDLAPGEPSFHLSLGLSYEKLNKPADAAHAYQDYLTMAPEAPDASQVKNRIEALKTPPSRS